MPDELKTDIAEALAATGDDNNKRVLLLLLRLQDELLERIEALVAQMTVPAERHAEDHRFISEFRSAQGGVKRAAVKVATSVLEKGALVAAGALAAKLIGG